VILACIVLSVTNVAAFWAWRLAEVSLESARRNGHAEFLRANKAAKEYSSVVGELMVCRKDLDYVKASWDKSSSEYAKEIEKLHESRAEVTRRLGRLNDINIDLQNEIDGLNVDKLHLKSELAKYRAIHEKRKAQKAANMRRFRAKQKEAKG
jgi:septal ring factor EnvC (AmiA/AmiB activator)